MALKSVMIDSFLGGYNDRQGDVTDEPIDSQLTVNTSISGDGRSIAPRGGSKKFDTSGTAMPAKSAPIEANMIVWQISDLPGVTPTNKLVVSVEGDIFSLDISAADVAARTQSFNGTSGHSWDFQPAKNAAGTSKLWCVNGTDANQQMDAAGTCAAWTINNGSAQKPTCICYWKGRMVAAGGTIQNSRLILSAIGDPETWAATDFLDLRDINDPADQVVDMKVSGEDLIVFRRNSIWRVYDSTNFNNQKIHDIGVARVNQVVDWEGRLYFPSRNGLYSTDGVNLKNESRKLKNLIYSAYSEDAKSAIARDGRLFWVMGGSVLEQYLTLEDGQSNHPIMNHVIGSPGLTPVAIAASWDPAKSDRVFTLAYSTGSLNYHIIESFKNDWIHEVDADNNVSVALNAFYATGVFRLTDRDQDKLKRIVRLNLGITETLPMKAAAQFGPGIQVSILDGTGFKTSGSSGNLVGINGSVSGASIQVMETKLSLRDRSFALLFQWVSDPTNVTNVLSRLTFCEALWRGGNKG